jgi:hypothetical protein
MAFMMRVLNTAILGALVILFGVIAFAVFETPPTSEDLDTDLADTRQKMKQLDSNRQKYEGGAIKNFMDLNYEILSATESMLEQKRLSTLRRLGLEYRVDSKPLQLATAETLKAIDEDRAAAQKKADAAQAEADRYTGGLIQAMALMKVQTERLSVSILNLKYYSAKYGIGLSVPAVGDSVSPSPPKEPPGRIVKDRDAL